MRKVILGLAVSLDSFIEGPNGEYDWCFTDQDYGMNEFLSRVDSVFFGRRSYELARAEAEAMSWMPPMKEYIFSNTLQEVKEGAVLVSGDIAAKVRAIKNEAGKDIWLFGGSILSTALLKEGLIDELWLSIHPILLGKGKSLFETLDNRVKLTLLDSKTYDTGLVSVRYGVG